MNNKHTKSIEANAVGKPVVGDRPAAPTPSGPASGSVSFDDLCRAMPDDPMLRRAVNAIMRTSDPWVEQHWGASPYVSKNRMIDLSKVLAAIKDRTIGRHRHMGKKSIEALCVFLGVSVDARPRCPHCGQVLPRKRNNQVQHPRP